MPKMCKKCGKSLGKHRGNYHPLCLSRTIKDLCDEELLAYRDYMGYLGSRPISPEYQALYESVKIKLDATK
jgi:hypothetical protein